MDKKEYKWAFWIFSVFALFYFLPKNSLWFNESVIAGLDMLNDYAKQHVLTCLVPAFFIAGAITVFLKKESVLKLLGNKTKKIISYSVASVSGSILAVCSCTVLPLFAGIRQRGAGLGPAITFLFSGPAINIAAIFLTMSVLGFNIGIARVIFAILLSILVGLTMEFVFKEKKGEGEFIVQKEEDVKVGKWSLIIFFFSLLGILIVNGLQINSTKKMIVIGILILSTILVALFGFTKRTTQSWLVETWDFTKTLVPYLFVGVFVAGFLMPLLPEDVIVSLVGSNSLMGNLIASVFGAFMYFSTLTEIPILQALMAKGMHQGPALALLLAGPSLSLPNMLVVRRILGNKKTAVYVLIVIIYSTIAGLIFGGI